jgi:small subunit ribosomal protein S17
MIGTITSNKMQKALTVVVYTTKLHSKYKKRFKTKKSYSVACSDSTKFEIGQQVEIINSIPVSKTIRFRVVE